MLPVLMSNKLSNCWHLFFSPENKTENNFFSLQRWLVTQVTLPTMVPHLSNTYDENLL